MKIKRNSLFLKYLISYTIMFMLPSLVLAFFINNVLLERLREQYLKNSSETLNQIIFDINQDLVRLDMITEHVLINNGVRPTFNLTEVDSAVSIIKELRKYTVSNNFTREIAVYFHGDNFVYSSQTSNTLDKFITNSYYYEKQQTRDLFVQLIKSGEEGIIPYENIKILGQTHNLLTIVKFVKIAGNSASLVFFIDAIYPEAMRESGIYVFDDNDTPLREIKGSNQENAELYKEQMIHAYTEGENFTALGESGSNLFAIIDTVPNYNWKVAYIGDEQAIYGDFKTMQVLFWILLCAVILISVIFTAVNMALNYNPLRKLSKTAKELYDKEHQGVYSEWTSIKDTLTYFFDENNKIKKQSVPAIRASFLQQLLKGRIESQEEFEKISSAHDMQQLFGERLFVLICCFRSSKNVLDVASVQELVNVQLNGYCREHSEKNTYIFVGSISLKQSEKLPYLILNVHALLVKASGKSVTVAISSLHDNFCEIPSAFMEASLAFDYRFVKGLNNVIEYSELVLNDRMGAAYPQQLFDKLTYQIKHGSPDQITLALDNIVAYIKNTDLPLYYAKGLCYQLINNVSVIISELGEMAHVKQNPLSYATVLAEFETADELIVAVKNICMNICDYIQESSQMQKTGSIQNIKNYIESTCLNINFSIQNVADEFNMTLPTLSLFFKNNTGTNVSDYATIIRMKAAKEMLLQGGKKLDEIAEKVGYMSASSFIRRFKAMYGVTPGQFVQMNNKKD